MAKLSQWACSCLFNMNIDDFLMHLRESPIPVLQCDFGSKSLRDCMGNKKSHEFFKKIS